MARGKKDQVGSPEVHHDTGAFIRHFHIYRERLVHYALVRQRLDAEDARDAASDAFAALWLRMHDTPEDRVWTALRDHVREQAKRERRRAVYRDRKADVTMAMSPFGPVERLEAVDLEQAVRPAMAALPPAQRKAVEASVLGEEEGATRSPQASGRKAEANRRSEGRAALRAALAAFLDEPWAGTRKRQRSRKQ